jgi:adenylate cyclase
MTLKQVAERAAVSPDTLRRWVKAGLVPHFQGEWTPAAVAEARLIARLRARGHSLAEIREASRRGRLAFAYVDDLLPSREGSHSLREAAKATGLEPRLIERIYTTIGFSTMTLEHISDDDLRMLHDAAAVLAAGLPLVAFLQLARVYGQALAQIADAEVRLFHIYVHEPLMRDGVPGLETAEAMEGLARQLLPRASPFMDHAHGRFLAHFVEQDMIGHMESALAEDQLDLGRLRVAIAFADLAGYTRLTEEQGDEQAVSMVERFVETVEHTLPGDARVIKTLGDEVMVVGSDPGALTGWAVDFQSEVADGAPAPRIGVHFGETLYRDGDYYGREVNQAARVVARAAGGEVLVTRPVVEATDGALEFQRVGEVVLKGFAEPTEIFLALARRGGSRS